MALATPTRSGAAGSGERLFDDNFLGTLEYLHIIARKILSGQLKAERKSRKKGISIEFADHRPYSPGDDFRFIDWGVFFRTDQLFIKLFEEEEDLHVYILLDCSQSMAFGTPGRAASFSAWTYSASDRITSKVPTGDCEISPSMLSPPV